MVSSTKSHENSADNYLIDKLAKYIPDNIFQESTNLLKNFVNSNFDVKKIFECEFRCPNGGKITYC